MNGSLAKIGRGTTIALVGSAAAALLTFANRALIARSGTEAEYGTFSLAFAIFSIAVVVASIGMQQGIPRSIAHAGASDNKASVQGIVSSSIQLGLISGVATGVIVFLLANVLAVHVFHDDALSSYVRVLALAIPCFTLIHVIVSIFRGFADMKPTVCFRDVAWRLLFALSLSLILAFNLAFKNVFYGLLASIAVSFVLLLVYASRRLDYTLLPRTLRIDAGSKDLFLFSLPLLLVSVFQMVILWTDTFMLGALKGSAEVGLYNAAHPFAHLLSSPLQAMMLAYVPVTSGLLARLQFSEMRRNFAISTKWLSAATLPLFLLLLLYPGAVLSAVFGVSYVPAEQALRILALGFMVNNATGTSGGTLIALGQTRFLMWAAFAAVAINVGLNGALIPSYGIEGAAIASAVALTIVNLVRCWRLYSLTGAIPLTMNLVKPAVVSIGLVFLVDLPLGSHVQSNLWMLPLLLVVYYAVFAAATPLTRSLDEEDLALLAAARRRASANVSRIKLTLRRFL